MSGWDDPTGWPWYAVGLCDRCHRRFPLHELMEDGNLPGLRVCRDDWDELDPYRLPARQTENISLPFVRPDVSIAITGPPPPPFELPGFILIESGAAYVITEGGIFVITEGVSDLTTEGGPTLATTITDESLIVEPWAS